MTILRKAPLLCLFIWILALGAALAVAGFPAPVPEEEYTWYKEPAAAMVCRRLSVRLEEGTLFAPEEPDQLFFEKMTHQNRPSDSFEHLEQWDGSDASFSGSVTGNTVSGNTVTGNTVTGNSAEEAVTQPSGPIEIPEGVCSPVVPAVDYGNTKSIYLSPEGTEYKRDERGVFAPNGEFYYLQPVEDEYFDDALFIGDSRTEGLFRYGAIEMHGDFFARRSMRTDKVFEKKIPFYSPEEGETNLYLEEVLQRKQYGKIYICLGINELGGYSALKFYETYREVLLRIRGMQPDALIFIQGIMHVTKADAKKSNYETNTNIVERNYAISMLANGRDIFYLDMNGEVCDEDGNLRDDLSGDGVHLKISGYYIWKDFLMANGIKR